MNQSEGINQRKRFRWFLLPLLWMGLIFYASSMPYQQQNIQPLMHERFDLSGLEPLLEPVRFTYHQSEVSLATHGVYGMIEFFIRKGAHVFVFFVLFICWFIALAKTRLRQPVVYLLSLLFAISYGFFDEWHQGFTPNRTPYMGDVLIDAIGVLLAFIAVFIAKRSRANRR